MSHNDAFWEVPIKAYFVNEICEVKREVSQLKGQLKTVKYESLESNFTEIRNLKLRFAGTKFIYKVRVATITNYY